jgi:hypothetical protein
MRKRRIKILNNKYIIYFFYLTCLCDVVLLAHRIHFLEKIFHVHTAFKKHPCLHRNYYLQYY